ncbi:MAG: replicative DNA helicase [Chloroflexi bacterium]|nr:replicative DNA helicase [Chloroflexota bacterium]
MTTSPDKTIPNNTKAEEALLGSLLIDPDVILQVASLIEPADFYVKRHGWIYDVIRSLHDQRQPVDFLTVTDELERRNQLADVGGPAQISTLINSVPSAVHAFQYAEIVRRTAIMRQLITAAGEIARIAYDDTQDEQVVVDKAEQLIFKVAARHQGRDLVPVRSVVHGVIDEIEMLARRGDEILGVPCDFRELDKLLGGLQKSDLIIVAARPGMGKTSLALTVALNAAKNHGRRVAVFSLEMSNEQLVQRLLSQEAGIDNQRLRLGKIDDAEWGRLAAAAAILSECPIYIDDSAALSPFELRTKARRLHAEVELDLLIVDYMQLMNSGTRSENRVQEISYISRSLKQLARELNVPVMALSQLSRQVENRQDKHPQLSDLRDSGSIEQDADVVMFVYRDEVYNENTEYKNVAEIIVAKHRHGPTNSINLYFERTLTRFANLAMIKEDLHVTA